MDLSFLDKLSREELQQLRQTVDDKMKKMEWKDDLDELLHLINEKGYEISTKKPPYKVPAMKMKLRYNIDVYSYDHRKRESVYVLGSSEKQPDWVNALKFKHYPNDSDDWQPTDDWEYNDGLEPDVGHTYIPVYIYYKGPAALPEKFRVISQNGVENWEIREEQVYVDGRRVGKLEEVETSDLFIVPEGDRVSNGMSNVTDA